MLIGFCNTKRSVALMLLMVVCSNAQQIQNPSADTDCPVERLDLESHLASLEAQLNNVQRIVSTLNNPLIKEDCTVNLASFGYDDSTKYGYIRTSGGSSLDIYVHGQHHRYRGVNLVELDATTCKVRRKHHFDTHSNADDRVQFLEALESATTGSIIVGVTADTPENEDNFAFKNIAASFFRRYGMTLTGQLFREKFAFILQKGYPKKTLFRKSPRYGESLRLSVALSGEQKVNTLQGPEKSFTFTGTNATFTCVSPLKNCVNMSWYKETDRYPSWDSWTKINYNIEERFGGKFIVENSTQGCTLIVTNVQQTDYKYFRCTYPNYSHGFAKLVVIDGPREHPLTGPENQFGFVGSDVNFTCISPVGYCVGMNWFKQKVGRGRETISISRFGNYSRAKYTVMGSRMGCQLTVKRLELNDASSVICEIVISHRTYEGTASLLVFNRTENPLKGPRDSLTYVGANATFKCVSPLENCVNITWYKQEFVGSQSQWRMINYEPRPRQRYLLEKSRFSCSLTVMNVYVTDSGLFKCQFMNHFEAIAQLSAIYAQENPLTGSSDAAGLVGRNIAFTCVSPLKNCVEMTWWVHIPGRDAPTIFNKYEGIYLSDKYIVENSAAGCQLTVKRLQLNDTATYYCEIRISQTIYDHVAQLFVFSVQQENPLKGPNISMSFVGTNADFTCVSPLKSCAYITWHQDLRINSAWARIDPDSNPDLRYKYVVENSPLGCKLTVKNVQISDYAPIKCIFLLTFERTADLMVFAAQENPLTGPVNYTGFVGQNFTFDCSSPLKNCVGINWYKKTEGRDRDTIFSGNNGIYLRDKYTVGKSTEGCRLTVKNVDFNDKGSVSCEILISHRSFTGTAALIVRNHTIGR